jgi:hypothetical protein
MGGRDIEPASSSVHTRSETISSRPAANAHPARDRGEPASSMLFSSTGASVGRIILAATPGHPQEDLTLEAVGDNWTAICALKGLAFPASTREAFDRKRKWRL